MPRIKTLGRIRRRFRKDEKASEKLRYERAQKTLALTAASVDSASADKCLQQKPLLSHIIQKMRIQITEKLSERLILR